MGNGRKFFVLNNRSRLGLFALLGCCLLAAACGQPDPPPTQAVTPYRADWVIKSRIDFRRSYPLPLESFSLSVPFRTGSIYGNPTSGSFPDAVVRANYRFKIDLNQGHNVLLSSLVETRFVSSGLRVEPVDTRIARVSPALTDPDEGSSLGITNWVNPATDHTLMLLYFDRPARVTGDRYDIEVTEPGYVWVEKPPSPALGHVVPKPNDLVLAFFPKRNP